MKFNVFCKCLILSVGFSNLIFAMPSNTAMPSGAGMPGVTTQTLEDKVKAYDQQPSVIDRINYLSDVLKNNTAPVTDKAKKAIEKAVKNIWVSNANVQKSDLLSFFEVVKNFIRNKNFHATFNTWLEKRVSELKSPSRKSSRVIRQESRRMQGKDRGVKK